MKIKTRLLNKIVAMEASLTYAQGQITDCEAWLSELLLEVMHMGEDDDEPDSK